jgi:C4-dicarboxylate-specific signal transduction histidine kinase
MPILLNRIRRLVTEPDPELPLVEAHQMQLQQVRLNLVVNAFEAMRETPVIAEGQGEREV